jgi:dUTP pyrophosphatase
MNKKILEIKFKKLDKNAKSPVKAYDTDAGIDFFANENKKIIGGAVISIATGIKVEIPKGYCLVGRDRSGIASTTSLILKAGVIDESYRGEIKCVMANYGSYPVSIKRGDKIAQFLLLPVPQVILTEVDEISEVTDRGTKGFGSSDKKEL